MSARDRWSGFLTQIETRHNDLVREAFEGAKEALPELGFDTTPVAVALGAVRGRLQDLESKITDTWDGKVDETYEAEGIGHDERHQAREHGERLRRHLERQRERLEPHAFAHAAHVIHQRAVAERKDVNCTRCGAPLQPPVGYRAVEVRCGSCGAVGIFEPSSLLRQVEATGSHAIAWVASEREWHAMMDAQEAVRAARSPAPLALLQAYEAAQIEYWTRYFQVKGGMVLEIGNDPNRHIRSRLDFWYAHSAEHEEAWRNAGRPRRLPPA